MTSVYSKISPDSTLTVNGRFDYFKTPPTETTQLGTTYVSAQPSSISDNGNIIQVVVPADDSRATDYEKSFVIVKGKFVKNSDRGDLPAANDNALTAVAEDLLGHALFDRCTLWMNNSEVFHTSNYAQMAYIRRLLFSTRETREGRLAVEGLLPPTVDAAKDFANISEEALAVRKSSIAAGKELTLIIKPETVFTDCSRHIPPGTSLKLVMHKANAKSFTLSSQVACDIDFKITSFEWMVCRVDLNPSVVTAWGSQLVAGANYLLPVMRPRVRSFTVHSGVTEQRICVQEQDTLPLSLAVAFVEQRAIVGDFTKSQFRYSPNNISSVELTVDGITIGKTLHCDFVNGDAAHAYVHSLTALGMHGRTRGNGLTYDEFKTNKTVFAWVLSDDHSEEEFGTCFHLKKQGSLEIVIRFSQAVPHTLNAQVFELREDIVKQNLEGVVETVEAIV